jgi:tripartite-type tricarboxylate transporter receptor subunit TctC
MNFDALKNLDPVIQLSRQPIALAVHSSLGINSLGELITLAKQQPGLRYATGSGVGSPQHMVVQWFARLADVKLEQVTYRGGAQAINDLLAAHVKIGSLGSTPLLPHYKAGTLRLLAQSTRARSPSLPDVPTFEEVGIKGLVLDQWLGVFVPIGTPPAINALLNAEINRALAEATIRESFLQSGQEPIGGSAAQFAQLVHDDYEKFGRLVKELNVKANWQTTYTGSMTYSITSSARASSDGGTSRPSVLAVLRLRIVSYLVGACTGRSAGFSPFRTRST